MAVVVEGEELGEGICAMVCSIRHQQLRPPFPAGSLLPTHQTVTQPHIRKYGEILLSTYSFRQRNTNTSQRDKEALEGNDDASNDDAPYVRRNAILAVNAIYKLPQGDNLLVDAPEMIEKMLTTEADQ
ncbi:uncharacterized protein LOC110901466 [Helianthus annuus]|uniref:uncharacterized protein LOC110901466 n=1 Tax=Helianthus annuus TaxID=4232 RepID=UPI0016532EBC|nr:uncharacterized protein LOC110901466 [Helianthus annuus]